MDDRPWAAVNGLWSFFSFFDLTPNPSPNGEGLSGTTDLKSFLEKYKYHFFIAVVAMVGYWQVAFFRHTLKWDMIDQYFPWRYFVSECLRNHVLPFWNPYQHWGYAIHADPQSGVWYPVVWLISLLHGYDVYALQFEFMLHIVL